MSLYEHSIAKFSFFEKAAYFGILKSELCCIIWNKYKSFVAYSVKFVNCYVHYKYCISVYIVKFNIVYDSFSRWKAFLTCPTFWLTDVVNGVFVVT
jgi:hypothetical protein